MNYVSSVVSPVFDLNEIIHKHVALLDGPMVHSLLHVEENNFLEKAAYGATIAMLPHQQICFSL